MSACRAYYHCRSCRRGHCPFDDANQLQGDHLSPGLRPLVCLAGTLASFRGGSDDLLRRFCGLRVCASVVRLAAEQAGRRLQEQQRRGGIVVPPGPREWDFRVAGRRHTAAFVGLDAFSVPMQRPGGNKAEHRMLYVATLYTPDKSGTHYLVDFDLDQLAAQMRAASVALGLGRANQLVAISDGGNGLEEALRRHFFEDLTTVLDWYHASGHLHDYAKALHPRDAAAQAAWAGQAKGLLYERGGEALLAHLRAQAVPEDEAAADELRKLINYFADNAHRTDYPSYRSHGWDIGSGPTEAACKVVGARLKGSGMRWLESGASQVAPLRALYLSGAAAWDAFFALAS